MTAIFADTDDNRGAIRAVSFDKWLSEEVIHTAIGAFVLDDNARFELQRSTVTLLWNPYNPGIASSGSPIWSEYHRVSGTSNAHLGLMHDAYDNILVPGDRYYRLKERFLYNMLGQAPSVEATSANFAWWSSGRIEVPLFKMGATINLNIGD
jgi:hypothetical protein